MKTVTLNAVISSMHADYVSQCCREDIVRDVVRCCALERAPAAVDAALQCIMGMAALPALQVLQNPPVPSNPPFPRAPPTLQQCMEGHLFGHDLSQCPNASRILV